MRWVQFFPIFPNVHLISYVPLVGMPLSYYYGHAYMRSIKQQQIPFVFFSALLRLVAKS